MQAIRYQITTLSPLLISSNTGDPNMVSTLDYIPGTHLRGLFANLYIRKKGITTDAHRDEIFYRWFLKGEIGFTNGYIVQKKGNDYEALFPIPLSIQREKGKENTAYDLILQDEDFDKQTTPVSGYGRLSGNQLYTKSTKKSLNFHHARDRERGVSKEGQIFNYESIQEGQTFQAYITGESKDLQDFLSLMGDGIFYLGRSRNSQYGRIKIRFLNQTPTELPFEIEYSSDSPQLILTLLSDTIVYNEFGYSTTDITELEKKLNCKIKRAFIRQNEHEGFVSVWKLKTPSEIAFRAGSCFLIEDYDLEKLRKLQKTGIGSRTNEGFGRFALKWYSEMLSEPIGLREAEEEEFPEKPKSVLSKKVDELIRNIIKENLKAEVQKTAVEDSERFENIPSKSLLSRLGASAKAGIFEKTLKELKLTAKSQLERCRDKDTTLYDFLSSEVEEKIIKRVSDSYEIDKLCKDVYKTSLSNLIAAEEFIRELKEIYLTTLFSTMRIRKKAKEA